MLTNKELTTLIKMENLIGLNEKQLFNNPTTVDGYTITKEDFIDFMNIIENIIQDKYKMAKQQNKRNKDDKKYHSIVNKISYHRKAGNVEKMKYWQHMLQEYKQQKNK